MPSPTTKRGEENEFGLELNDRRFVLGQAIPTQAVNYWHLKKLASKLLRRQKTVCSLCRQRFPC